uniref:Macaca fascicularis brain cDNA, clone: QflA-17506 n=1 Tax=Macaca fascicularis TaxID=9541 RepID=I7GBU6_MACFA|nr:unnamed protein product [Macaca fascicularis]
MLSQFDEMVQAVAVYKLLVHSALLGEQYCYYFSRNSNHLTMPNS